MNRQLGPARPFQPPAFTVEDADLVDQELKRRLRRPMVMGAAVVGVFVVGMTLFASVAPMNAAVVAPGQVRVEANRKTLRHLTGGAVREILVREGQKVKAGQPLIRMDEVQAKAAYDVMRSQHDALLAQIARLQAETSGQRSITFPPELTSRASDPAAATLMRDQEFLFNSRLTLYESQTNMLTQRVQQFQAQAGGIQAQLESVAEQTRLTNEELAGYKTLHEKGYAPKTLILRYERTLADLGGRRGQLLGELGRNREQMAEAQIQLSALREERITKGAEALRDAQTKLAEVGPRLAAATQAYQQTVIRSPSDGFVLNLTAHTPGGVIGAGEEIMDVVPVDTPLIVTARIKPDEVDDVRPGMDAKVRLSAFNYRKVQPVDAKVIGVSADALVDQKTGASYFNADLRIPVEELRKLPKGANLSPGMPAQAMITTGRRTIMGYILGPITDTVRTALREE
ncbi:MAG: HlyD family type I secretion periplasmic adaptor subunit [Phenylobacterium sp.]|jgi:HlyD family type I secretion membrane fusion protein|uniref:HlyD family type I secretion periplasmic adaptor subunit n=1 Tax=Phenylobacterium sp. TaxID=1871053 RepID=UPI002A35DC84|nr:HlyD family type I secretion periplasmic adaptor subunit [Phenylobacterium sp.]MDX9999646.1 HlyD family type I secretion periplasmic adaptor subunit [Phenylobacterium sp.]